MIFRDDDISVDTNLEHLKKITNTFLEFGIKESYSVTPFGLTNPLWNFYGSETPIELIEKEVGVKPITKNIKLVKFLKGQLSNGHEMFLHGWVHTRVTDYSVDVLVEKISNAKEFLETEFNTKIKYFVPPFNCHNISVDQVCNLLGMEILDSSGDALEYLVKENKLMTKDYCWYHWCQLDKKELEKWLKSRYLFPQLKAEKNF